MQCHMVVLPSTQGCCCHRHATDSRGIARAELLSAAGRLQQVRFCQIEHTQHACCSNAMLNQFTPLHSDTPAIPPEQLPSWMSALPGWKVAADQKSISRQFTAKNFVAGTSWVQRRNACGFKPHTTFPGCRHLLTKCAWVTCVCVCMCHVCCTAIDFFQAVKEVAEAEGHHPDLHLTNYRDVQVSTRGKELHAAVAAAALVACLPATVSRPRGGCMSQPACSDPDPSACRPCAVSFSTAGCSVHARHQGSVNVRHGKQGSPFAQPHCEGHTQ